MTRPDEASASPFVPALASRGRREFGGVNSRSVEGLGLLDMSISENSRTPRAAIHTGPSKRPLPLPLVTNVAEPSEGAPTKLPRQMAELPACAALPPVAPTPP